MKKIIIPVIILLLVVGYLLFKRTAAGNPDEIAFSGTVEVTEVNLAFKVQGRLTDIMFSEGDTVKAGEEAASIDSTDQKLAVDSAKANVELSVAALNELLAGSRRQEIQNAQAAVDMARAALNRAVDDKNQASSDRDRFDFLYKNNGISKHDFEQYDTKYKKSVNTVSESEAAVKAAEDKLSLSVEGTRSETIKKASAAVNVAKVALNTALQNLKYTVINSPINGKILSRPMEPGEYVQPGSVVLSVGDLSDAWVRGYVSEKDLGRIHLGDLVEIKSDSYPDKTFKGRITYIADEAEFTPKSVQTPEERVNFMYRIKVAIDNRMLSLKSGMPVDGLIKLK